MHSPLTRRLIGVVVLAALAFTVSAFAQIGGVTGKCTGENGKPLVGYTILVERQDMEWSQRIKTNKKGEYTYIGLGTGRYKITLLDPSGKTIYYRTGNVALGDPTIINFDVVKAMASSHKQQMANPETAKKTEELQKDQKQAAGLKATYDQARLLYDQQHYSEAAAMFEQAVPMAKDENLPIVLVRLADAYGNAAKQEQNKDTRMQDQQKAIEAYQKVIQLNPNDAVLHNNLGSVYAEMGKVDDAQKEFQKAAEINPAGASGYYYNLGVVLVNRGKMDDAAESLKKATDLDPSNANAFYWYGTALLPKAQYQTDGTIVPVPGTIEAFQNYLKLRPNGQWAQAAQASLDQIQGKVPTEYKKAKK
ncbi:MAG: tetratricopeptide repeat protein [Candidatus Korobacteraceae bacterium]